MKFRAVITSFTGSQASVLAVSDGERLEIIKVYYRVEVNAPGFEVISNLPIEGKIASFGYEQLAEANSIYRDLDAMGLVTFGQGTDAADPKAGVQLIKLEMSGPSYLPDENLSNDQVGALACCWQFHRSKAVVKAEQFGNDFQKRLLAGEIIQI